MDPPIGRTTKKPGRGALLPSGDILIGILRVQLGRPESRSRLEVGATMDRVFKERNHWRWSDRYNRPLSRKQLVLYNSRLPAQVRKGEKNCKPTNFMGNPF